MPTKNPRVSFMISKEMLDKVDNYRFGNKFKNQTQAILSLIEKGLADFEPEKAPLYSSEAMKLAQDYDALDDYGKRLVRMVVVEEKARCEDQIEEYRPAPIYVATDTGAVKQKAPIPVSEDGLEDSAGSLMDFVWDMNPGQQEKFYNQMHKLKEPQKESSTSASRQKVDDKAPKSESPDQS